MTIQEARTLEAYEIGRQSVMRELTEAVQQFNDDDSMGIGQLIEVISPWLLPDEFCKDSQ